MPYVRAQGLGARVGPRGGVWYVGARGNVRHAMPARVHQLPNGGLAFQPYPKEHPNVWRVVPQNPGGPARGVQGLGQVGTDLADFITGATSWISDPSDTFSNLGTSITSLYSSAGGVDWINVGTVAVPAVAVLAVVKFIKGRKRGRRR
jgi:hypothetical protein